MTEIPHARVVEVAKVYDRYWRLHVRLPERYGHRCRVVARGAMNSAIIEFEDGERRCVSRNAFRKLPRDHLAGGGG